jgi:hypothetical protein
MTGCGGAGGEDLFGGVADGGVDGGTVTGSRPPGDVGASVSPDGGTEPVTSPDAATGPLDASGPPVVDAGRDTGPVCRPETCQPAETCGPKVDACGNHYDCGTCSAPDTCVANHCGCTPKACPTLRPCGDMNDGCGHLVTCPGSCTPRDTCGGAGVANQCDNFTNACAQTKTPAQPECVGVGSSSFHVYCAKGAIDLRWCTANQSVPACGSNGGWLCNFPP